MLPLYWVCFVCFMYHNCSSRYLLIWFTWFFLFSKADCLVLHQNLCILKNSVCDAAGRILHFSSSTGALGRWFWHEGLSWKGHRPIRCSCWFQKVTGETQILNYAVIASITIAHFYLFAQFALCNYNCLPVTVFYSSWQQLFISFYSVEVDRFKCMFKWWSLHF